jgi:hypothetical protein
MFIPRRKHAVSVMGLSRFKKWLIADLNDRITNYMKHIRSWDAVSGSAFWQIPEVSNPRSQEPTTGSYHNPTPYFSTIRFNIILTLIPSSPQWYPTSACSDWNFVYISHIPMRATSLIKSFFRRSDDKHKLRIFSVWYALFYPSYSNFVRCRYKCKYPPQPWFKLHIHKRKGAILVTARTEIKGDLWQGIELSHVLVLKLYSGRLTDLFKINTLVYGGEKFYWECIGAHVDSDKQFMMGKVS